MNYHLFTLQSMSKNLIQCISIFFLSCQFMLNAVDVSYHLTQQDPLNQTVEATFLLEENEAIFAHTLHLSVNNHDMHLTGTSINIPALKKYVPEFKQDKQVYDQNFILTTHVTCNNNQQRTEVSLHISYLSTLENSLKDVVCHLVFDNHLPEDESDISTNIVATPVAEQEKVYQDHSWINYLENLVERTKTPWAQIVLALILGLLLSLTPCIYPMIPITIGILHSHGKKSLLSNFLGSMSYACGLATTFACLGLLATVAGSSFGSLLSQPLFVVTLVLFIGYMSLTMIGIIDMYIPSFMKGEIKLYKNFGPYMSAFLFGAISGTIASPCVSPGLALLLSIVATLGNNILGFILLFAFGIGLSFPLIIIGTFSNSLYLLPKSGMWMVEIKKALGFFMLATCFYYLSNILPIATIYWLFTGFTLFTAMFYLQGPGTYSSETTKTIYNGISIIMIGITIFMCMQSYEKTFYQETINLEKSVLWQADYATALQHAQETKTLLLVDFWANHCTICKAIDKKVFKNNRFNQATADILTFVKIDATQSNNPDFVQLKEQYKVYAQPTILLIEPATETILKRWTSEPYSMTIEDFITQLKKFS